MKRVAILQSNYIPWKGYFDLINLVDEFIVYDDMQYTRRDWRNRNKIKTAGGPVWLTIPVEVKGKYFQKINETVVSDPSWGKSHWQSLCHHYAKAPYFKEYRTLFEELYLDPPSHLSEINLSFMKAISRVLGIRTVFRPSSEFEIIDGKTERLVDLCRQTGATDYLSGPAAKDYIVASQFEEAGIGLNWMDYSGYPEYSQLHPPFEHGVTVLDLIFNEGPNATRFMNSFGAPRGEAASAPTA